MDDERFCSVETRLVHADALYEEMQQIFSARSAAEWIGLFAGADLLATPVNDYQDLFSDPQVADNYVSYMQPPDGGKALPIVGLPVIFSETPGRVTSMAPEFGQHTEEVLLEAGFDWEKISVLREEGAIGIH
jgi:crotonobetainyl-CoA:carnitine CoA-transferase CaiB-like acyl-CoA transferase